MKRHKIEFKVGDSVTFKPYETAHQCVVEEVDTRHLFTEQKDERVFYRLEGPMVMSFSTGLSIVESMYYNKEEITA